VPTPGATPGLPGLYEGAKYCDQGLYRPTYDSKMRTLYRPFEQIHSEQLVKRIYNWVSPIDRLTPAAGTLTLTLGQSVLFHATPPQPMTRELTVAWTVDGVEAGTGPELTFDTASRPPGTYTVEVLITDPTPLVRHDPTGLLQERHAWTVTVLSNEPPSLALLPNQSSFTPGEIMTVDLAMRNPGLPLTVDVYVGAILADGHTVLWLTSTNPVQGVIADMADSPATFMPILRGVTWPAAMDVVQEDYLVYTWNGGEGLGTYHLLAGWTRPGSLADGRIDDGDVVALGWVPVSLRPADSLAAKIQALKAKHKP
jgi:hypothetical protein